MTRIVAGIVGGRTLAVPPKGTRPTSDRVREAIFSRLEHFNVLVGSHVLDLYAGSGALGLEAASRGAATVVLVDAARAAAEVCARNVASLGLSSVRVVTDTAERFLQHPPAIPWDLVFLDPPYDLTEPALADVLAALETQVAHDVLVVVERSARSPEPIWPGSWELIAAKRYGETVVYFVEPAAPDDDDTPGVAFIPTGT